ncbi:MAG: M17 family peptidase N-terminal domain-containing protein, partial [Rubrivivax sp.]
MDFKAQTAAAALSALASDALIVVVAGEAVPADLDKALAAPLAAAVAAGDFALKAGSLLYLHKPEGVKAGRVLFAAAGGSSVKA